MKIGMLWFNSNPKQEIETKVQEAADYYTKKYGSAPNVCFVHPTMISSAMKTIPGMEIRVNQAILPNHFWIGVNNG